jgi:hypothetical protein
LIAGLEKYHGDGAAQCLYQHEPINDKKIVEDGFTPVQRPGYCNQGNKRNDVQSYFHNVKVAQHSKCNKGSQANYTQWNDDIKNGFAQAHLYYKCFELEVIIYCIVLYIEHDAQYCYEHEILNEEKETYEGRFEDQAIINAIK